MPVFINTLDVSQRAINVSGEHVTVRPGGRLTSYQNYSGETGWRTYSDSPYYSPVLQIDDIVISGEHVTKTVSLNPNTKTIRLHQLTDNLALDIYFDSTSNSMPIAKGYQSAQLLSYGPVSIDEGLVFKRDGKCRAIVIDPVTENALGTCQVVQYKE